MAEKQQNQIEEMKAKLVDFEKELRLIRSVVDEWEHPEQVPSRFNELETSLNERVTETRAELQRLGFTDQLDIKVFPVEQLAFAVKRWLALMGYTILSGERVGNREYYLTAEIQVGRLFQRVLVVCTDDKISANRVRRAVQERDTRRLTECWLISWRKPLPSSQREFSEDQGVRVSNFNEFVNDLVDFTAYTAWLEEYIKHDDIADYYLDHGSVHVTLGDDGTEISDDLYPSVDEYVEDWLNAEGISQLSILGGFGTGKTWFCRHFAALQLEKYKRNPEKERLPLLINLRDYTKQIDIRNMIVAWMDQHKVKTTASDRYSVFEELNLAGRFLLILDGFDEMAQKVDYDTIVKNFWQLATLAPVGNRTTLPGSKVILTSRTEYFRSGSEAIRVLEGQDRAPGKPDTHPQFEVIYLNEFTETEVETVLRKRLGDEKAEILFARLRENPYLMEIIRRPLLMDILIKTIPDLNLDGPLNLAEIYRTFTSNVMKRNIKEEKTFTSLADKVFFLTELAHEMLYAFDYPKMRIHFREIPERITKWFPQIQAQPEIDHYSFDLQNQTLLQSLLDGYYEFSHKSYAEYFVSLKFAYAMGAALPAWREGIDSKNLRFQKLPTADMARTMGIAPLSPEILEFLADMVDINLVKQLFAELRSKKFDEIRYLAGNILSLLSAMGETFEGKDLSNYCLRGARLTHASLRSTNLTNSDLRGATLEQVVIDHSTIVKNADFNGIVFGRVPGVHTIAYSPDSNSVAMGCYDGVARVMSIANGSVIGSYFGHEGRIVEVAFSPSGNRLATAGDDRTVRVYDTQSCKEIALLTGHKDKVFCLEFIDENTLASGSADKMFKIWDIDNKCEIQTLGEHGDYVCSIVKSPDHKFIASASGDHIVRVWDLETKQPCFEFDTGAHVHNIGYTPDGKFVVAFSDTEVACFNIATKKKKWIIERNDFAGFHSPLFVTDKYVAFRAKVTDVKVVSVKSGKSIHDLQPRHPTWVSSACFSPNGKQLVTASADGSLYVWDMKDGTKIKSLLLQARVTSDPIGKEIITIMEGLEEDQETIPSLS